MGLSTLCLVNPKSFPNNEANVRASNARDILEQASVVSSLEEALQALEADHDYLTAGGVFTKDFIDSYIALKRADIQRVDMTPHPVEFELYYSV